MNCPKCKSPIHDNARECEWCGFILIKQEDTKSTEQAEVITDLDAQLLELCKRGFVLAAVKLKKDKSTLGLKESKHYVDNLMLKNGVIFKQDGIVPLFRFLSFILILLGMLIFSISLTKNNDDFSRGIIASVVMIVFGVLFLIGLKKNNSNL